MYSTFLRRYYFCLEDIMVVLVTVKREILCQKKNCVTPTLLSCFVFEVNWQGCQVLALVLVPIPNIWRGFQMNVYELVSGSYNFLSLGLGEDNIYMCKCNWELCLRVRLIAYHQHICLQLLLSVFHSDVNVTLDI